MWNNNSARVSWTKLKYANILFNERRQGNKGSLLDQQLCIWEPLNIFIVVFSSVRLEEKEKKFTETHWNIFGVFGFLKQANKKQNREKLFTRESSQQAKEE